MAWVDLGIRHRGVEIDMGYIGYCEYLIKVIDSITRVDYNDFTKSKRHP